MATIPLRLTPSMQKPTDEGYLLSKSIINRFREMIENGDSKINERGKKCQTRAR